MSLEKIRLLSSAVSHMPLIFTFRDSGITEKYGFQLEVDIAGFRPPRKAPAADVGKGVPVALGRV